MRRMAACFFFSGLSETGSYCCCYCSRYRCYCYCYHNCYCGCYCYCRPWYVDPLRLLFPVDPAMAVQSLMLRFCFQYEVCKHN